jgi:membrane-associated phospholipid phosphatase
MAIAISTSTVLVKQHFIVDIPSGMLLAWCAWWLAPAVMKRLGWWR